MDRRVQKSKAAIEESFMQLLTEKGFEQITISEVAERANVNRGTIYLHYVDIYDLLDKCIEDQLARLFQHCAPDGEADSGAVNASLLRTFEYLEQHEALYRTLLTSQGMLSFRNHMHTMIAQFLREGVEETSQQQIKQDVLVQFLSSAAVGVIEWWLTNGMPYPAEEMVEQFWLLLERVQG